MSSIQNDASLLDEDKVSDGLDTEDKDGEKCSSHKSEEQTSREEEQPVEKSEPKTEDTRDFSRSLQGPSFEMLSSAIEDEVQVANSEFLEKVDMQLQIF